MRALAHTWTWNGGDTEVTYELTPKGKDVLLAIVHRRLGKDLTPSVMGGWDVHTGILEDVLKGVEPRPFWTTHDAARERVRGCPAGRTELGGSERDEGDLGAGTEAHGRPPASRAGADVDPHLSFAREPRDVRRVNEAHGERPGKELPRVRVAR